MRTLQELGGWRTLGGVQRYAHLSLGHLLDAVEKIAPGPTVVPGIVTALELGQNWGFVPVGQS